MLAICFMSFVVIVLTLESVFNIRPEKVAARRAKELLYVFNENTPDAEDALWVDEKEVDSDFVPAFSEDNSVQGMPVITNIQTWCSSQWTTNDS